MCQTVQRVNHAKLRRTGPWDPISESGANSQGRTLVQSRLFGKRSPPDCGIVVSRPPSLRSKQDSVGSKNGLAHPPISFKMPGEDRIELTCFVLPTE